MKRSWMNYTELGNSITINNTKYEMQMWVDLNFINYIYKWIYYFILLRVLRLYQNQRHMQRKNKFFFYLTSASLQFFHFCYEIFFFNFWKISHRFFSFVLYYFVDIILNVGFWINFWFLVLFCSYPYVDCKFWYAPLVVSSHDDVMKWWWFVYYFCVRNNLLN